MIKRWAAHNAYGSRLKQSNAEAKKFDTFAICDTTFPSGILAREVSVNHCISVPKHFHVSTSIPLSNLPLSYSAYATTSSF